jgi:hypothetical protein
MNRAAPLSAAGNGRPLCRKSARPREVKSPNNPHWTRQWLGTACRETAAAWTGEEKYFRDLLARLISRVRRISLRMWQFGGEATRKNLETAGSANLHNLRIYPLQ